MTKQNTCSHLIRPPTHLFHFPTHSLCFITFTYSHHYTTTCFFPFPSLFPLIIVPALLQIQLLQFQQLHQHYHNLDYHIHHHLVITITLIIQHHLMAAAAVTMATTIITTVVVFMVLHHRLILFYLTIHVTNHCGEYIDRDDCHYYSVIFISCSWFCITTI